MSVLITGMEMPTGCISCDFCNPFVDEPYCRRLMKQVPKVTRLDDCPLTEVSEPHGLIAREQILDAIRLELAQADACNDTEDYDSWMRVFDYVRKFPTIIPADPAEEGL